MAEVRALVALSRELGIRTLSAGDIAFELDRAPLAALPFSEITHTVHEGEFPTIESKETDDDKAARRERETRQANHDLFYSGG